jgi:hypothetical protein
LEREIMGGAEFFDPIGITNSVSSWWNHATAAPSNPLEGQLKAQAEQSAALQKQILSQPKQVASDNFLSTKNAQMNKLRMGLGSTITGAGLSTPTLLGGSGGKTKLGA